MIIKGESRARSKQLASHLLRQDQNESIRVHELRGTLADDVPGALAEMEARSVAAKSRRSLYHASISPEAHTPLTDVQIRIAVDMLEEGLGFAGQPRVVVLHQKKLREHIHVVWSRVDIEHNRAIPDSWNYRVHEEVARSLEALFGHRPVQRSSAKRRDRAEPRAPRDYELRQEERSGTPVARVTEELTGFWHASPSSQSFRKTLEEAGYRLARGDRRVLVVIDRHGEVHSLARRLQGISTKDLRERFHDTSIHDLPSVSAVRERRKTERLERHPKKHFAPAANEVTQRQPPARSPARAISPRAISINSSREPLVEPAGFAALSRAPKRLRVSLYVGPPNSVVRYRSALAIIIADFATKIVNARRNIPAYELAAALAVLLAEREAALCAVKQQLRGGKARSRKRTQDPGKGRAVEWRGARRRFRLRRLVRLPALKALR